MSNRPSSEIIYGFNLSSDHGIDSARGRAWEAHITADLAAPDSYAVNHRQRTTAQQAEVEAWFAAKAQRVAANARVVDWGCLDEPNYAIGVQLAYGDWDEPTVIERDTYTGRVLAGPPDMDARIAELCAWLGIEVQPCELLLLSSYG